MAPASIPGGRKCYFEEEYTTSNGYDTIKHRRREVVPYEKAILIGSESLEGGFHLPLFDLDYPARVVHTDPQESRTTIELSATRPFDAFLRSCGWQSTWNGPRMAAREAVCKFLDLAYERGLITYPYLDDPWLKEEGRSTVPFPSITFTVPTTLLPSSTSGHHHLYLDARLGWEAQYKPLLAAASLADVIEKKYYERSRDAGMAFLLKPGVTKAMLRKQRRRGREGDPLPY